MKRTPLKQVIDQHFGKFPNQWIKKVDFYIVADQYGHSPESVGRLLRLKEEAGEIQKSYYDSDFATGLVQYLKGVAPVKVTPQIIVKNGIAYEIPI